ncbi:MAG: asparagine synthase C-terminal domain-containing protein [Chloroherpetonaceae bacterium]|nr:asparagine synthase C-terminal domain-containing protein [Chthonomonadaceae bacterium]MDW8208893.1 asparagine synthase C-terminal domain-containing protein [Chloroherpetonaceae bacterium]
MGLLAGGMGPVAEQALRALLGAGACVHSGAAFTIGVANTGGARAVLQVMADGVVEASVGAVARAGCCVRYDPATCLLSLRVDPFGIHTLYTLRREGAFWFASDLRVLRRLLDHEARLDPISLHGYLCFSYVPAPRSVLCDAGVVPAGGCLQVDARGRCTLMETVEWREQPVGVFDQEAAVSQLRALLRQSVQEQASDLCEASVFLSGGLDSSLIAALLAEAGVRVHLFTLDFGPPYNGELGYARQVAAHLGRPLHVVPCGERQVQGALRATAAAMEQPFGDGVTVPLYLLGRAAAQVSGVVFNGEGGDQLFGGWNNKPMVAAELYAGAGCGREAAYLATFHRFYGLTDRLYAPRARDVLRRVDAGAWVRHALEREGFRTLLHRLRAANLAHKGAQNIAPRARQLAEAHGLQVRSPFFDPVLAQWSFGVPSEWFLQGACEKYLLKRVAEAYLPAGIVWREKRGMGVPTTEWCRRGLRRTVAGLLAPRRLKRDGWFDPEYVTGLIRGTEEAAEFRQRRQGEKLWLLVMLAVYREAHGLHRTGWEEAVA